MSLSIIDLSGSLSISNDVSYTLTVDPSYVDPTGQHSVTFTATDLAGNTRTKDVSLNFVKATFNNEVPYFVSGESVDVFLPLDEIVDASNYISHPNANISIDVSNSDVSNNVNFNTDACGNFSMTYDISDIYLDISMNKAIRFEVRETQDLSQNSSPYITVDGSDGFYVFGGIPYDASNLIAVTTGSYNLAISASHPFQIVDISGIEMTGTEDASGYYTGDASLNITGNFGVASFQCKEHTNMGGTNKLIYKA